MKIDPVEFAKKDRKEKEKLRKKELSYYPEKMKQFGLKPIDRFVRYCPNPSQHMKNGVAYAQRDLEKIVESIMKNEPWAVVSGLNPSAPLHFGHKVIFDELLWLQKQGGDIFIPVTNDESYVVGKTLSLAESRAIAYEFIIPAIIAMGFDFKKTHIFVDSDYKDIYNVAMDVTKSLTLHRMFGVFGYDKNENPGSLFYRGAVQLAQILLPQYPEFGGPKATIIPVGIDQHPYILLSRDIAEKRSLRPPAEICMKFIAGLDGQGKMSASREASVIYLNDNPEKVAKKIKKAYTGGSPLAKFQKKYGGLPDICPIYQIQAAHFDVGDRLYKACSKGEILCHECKKQATAYIVKYLTEFKDKFEKAKQRISDFILDTPIRSIL